MTDSAKKLALFALWPAIALVILLGVCLLLVAAWVMIPLGTLVRTDGTVSLRFPWSDR